MHFFSGNIFQITGIKTMKRMISYFTVINLVAILMVLPARADIGETTITKWKGNKKGAYTLRFDDSMWSHHDHTVPNLIKRGLVASFFINPGTERYGYGINTWESLVSRSGFELCPHTMNHTGAADLSEADYEIGEAFRTVWKLNPPDKSKLYPFSRGGGTTWPDGYREVVESKYPVADYSGDAVRYAGEDNRQDLINFAQKAMKDNAWHIVLTHGTGPDLEWLGFEAANFEALLDYLASVKKDLWIGTAGDIYKYVTERKTGSVQLLESTDDRIRLDLTSETDPEWYDYPLTLITDVPADWTYCHVRQGMIQGIYPVTAGKILYDAIPNRGEIILSKSGNDNTPPEVSGVRDGPGTDIDVSLSTTEISANWDAAEDKESGISRYWYRIGTTPGGSEVLDWIDNGLARSFTTSRTHFSLVRGGKYYVTVKAVNGAGLSSEIYSDGFLIHETSGYILLKENFDNGYLTQWDDRTTRTGSQSNLLYLSNKASREGTYGMQCHLEPGNTNPVYLTKQDMPGSTDLFTRFYFMLSDNFTMPEENGNLQLLELRNTEGEFVAGIYIGNTKGIGIHAYAMGMDDTGYRTSVPAIREDYPLMFVPVEKGKWMHVDLRTIADAGGGGLEFRLNGKREGLITNRFTDGKQVHNLSIGVIRLPGDHLEGEIFFDDITVSDSILE
jgi:peptidoglycan/xylan/chitin deacetylase (PgdA/CDA1 family)